MLIFSGSGNVPIASPSASEILVTANAEIEASVSDIVAASGVGLSSGVAGAHGRVYNNVTSVCSFTYPGGQEEFVSAGCRFNCTADATGDLFSFRRVSGSVAHISVARVAGGTFRVADSANSTNYDSGSANISLTTWFYLMLYVRLHDTLGEFIAKLFDASGTLIETLTQTGIDTLNSGNKAEFSVWDGRNADAFTDHLWTDLNGAFQGCGYVETRSPTSNGDTNSWSRGGTDTGNNWDQVDEVPKNTTSTIFSTGADQVDLYNFQDRAQAGTPVTVQQVVYARAHTAGTRQYKTICKIGGAVYEGDTFTVTSTSSDTAAVYNWQNNPATGNAWTDSDINSAQFGVKSVTTDVRVQAVCLQILVSI